MHQPPAPSRTLGPELGPMGERGRHALRAMLYTMLAALPLVLAAAWMGTARSAELVLIATLLLAALMLTWLYRRGRDRAALAGLVATLVLSAGLFGMTHGSMRTSGMLALVAAIVVGGLFLGRLALVLTVVAGAAITGGLVIAQNLGWLIAPDETVRLADWVVHVAVLAAIALNIGFARGQAAQAMRRAREGEAWLAAVLRSAPGALIISSLDEGRVVEVNAAYERTFGLSREQAMGRTAIELNLWVDAADRAALVGRLRQVGRIDREPMRLRRAGGEVFDALLSSEVLDFADERRIVTAIADVSAELRARQALQASEVRFRHLFEASPVATSIVTPDEGRFVDCNAAYVRLLGRPREALVGRCGRDIGLWKDWSQRERARAMRQRDGAIMDQPADLVHADGRVLNCRVSSTFIEIDGRSLVLAQVIDDTERQQAEVALRASEQRFQTLFDSNPAALVVQDRDDRRLMLLANAAAERMFRASADEVVGREQGRRFWSDEAQLEAFWGQVDRDGHAGPAHVQMRRADGEVFDALISGEMTAQQGARHALVAITDISEEMRMRAEQRASEQRFTKVFHSSPIAMTITRLDENRFLEANDSAARLLGHPREQLVGRDVTAAKGPWSLPGERERFVAQLALSGQLLGHEARLCDRAGQVIEARVYAERMELAGVACVLESILDVTEQLRQNTQLLAIAEGVAAETGEAFFRKLVEQLARATGADRVLVGEVIDGGARVRTVARLVDGAPAPSMVYDLPGTPCEQVLHQCRMQHWPSGVAEQFPRDPPLAQAGMQGYIGAPLIGVEGRPVGIMNAMSTRALQDLPRLQAVFRIFSARAESELVRLQREREIAALNAGLEQRVRERTAQLVATNDELEAFAYSASHDLRAPLNGIQGFTSLLLLKYAEQLPAEARGYLEHVRNSTQRMARLIEDLLALSRVSRGELVRKPVDLTMLAHGVAAELARSDPQRQVSWRIAEGLEARADPGLVHIALANLLGNAWKYTRKASNATIWLEQGARDGDLVEFRVRDNGAGFDMAQAEQLFQPFGRLHSESEFEGTGVGLATVRRVVERHGGRVRGEGEVGAGATIHFSLPAASPL